MDRYRVKPGTTVDLSASDPNDKSAFDESKKSGQDRLKELVADLDTAQELLYAEHRHKVLVVLQGWTLAERRDDPSRVSGRQSARSSCRQLQGADARRTGPRLFMADRTRKCPARARW